MINMGLEWMFRFFASFSWKRVKRQSKLVKFLIKYNYCARDKDCLVSKEYIKASINENFDKVIMKISVDYINDEKDFGLNNFYDFFLPHHH